MSEEYLPIPEGRCPSCYNPVGLWYGSCPDPILTPKGFSGEEYVGIQKITKQDMKCLMDYWAHIGRMVGTWGDLELKDMLFYNNIPVLIQIKKNHIIYLRGLVESVLDTLGWSLNQYFNWTNDGYLVRNTKSTWSDILDTNNNFKMKAEFIEELRQGMLKIWREPWNKEFIILYVDDIREGWVSEYRTGTLNDTSISGRMLNNHWWAFYFSAQSNTSISGDLTEEKWTVQIKTEEASDLQVGANCYFKPELELNIRNSKLNGSYSPVLKKGDRNLISKLEIDITKSIVTSERLCDKNQTSAQYDPDNLDIVEIDQEPMSAYNMITVEYTIIPIDYEGLYIDYTPENAKILTYYTTEEDITDPLNPYDLDSVIYDTDMEKFLQIENFNNKLDLSKDFVDLFNIDPSEWKLVTYIIKGRASGNRRSVQVWGDWQDASAPDIRYVDEYYSKNSADLDFTLEKCFIYYDTVGVYTDQRLTSENTIPKSSAGDYTWLEPYVDTDYNYYWCDGDIELESIVVKYIDMVLIIHEDYEIITIPEDEPYVPHESANLAVIIKEPPIEGSDLWLEGLTRP